MDDDQQIVSYLNKAVESLAGAESEYANRRFGNCANRAYYACFQAAVSALRRAGVGPSSQDRQWRHEAVQALFAAHLINRRKLFPAAFRDSLGRGTILRVTADYTTDPVSETQSLRGLRRARDFVEAIRREGERGR